MTEDGLESLLARLELTGPPRETDRSEPDGDTALVVSCSMTRHGPDVSLWPVDPLWDVTAVTTLGNQARERHGDETVLEGSLAHLATEWDPGAVLVVGHTACDVVGNAYEQYAAPGEPSHAGVEARIDPIVSLVRDAFHAGVVEPSTPPRTARHRLVEYNVVRQVEFLTGALPASTTVVGYVSDQDGAYGTFPRKHYLVTVDGATDDAAIRSRLPDDEPVPVASLLR